MRPEKEPLRRPARAVPDLDAEREVDFGRYVGAVAGRWWLVLLAVVVGALVGWLLSSATSSNVHRAQATIYLGQPIAAAGSAQLPSPATNVAAVREIVRSDELVDDVASQVGVPAGRLRNSISTSQVTGAAARSDESEGVFTISVRGPWAGETVARATNLLATAVIERTSGYVDAKIRAYEGKLRGIERELASLDERIDNLQRAASSPGLSDSERLILVSLIGFAEDRRFQLVDDRSDTQLVLTQARDIERGSVITEARASQVTPRSSRSSMIVGGLVGLLVGLALALAWEPLARRRRLRVSTP